MQHFTQTVEDVTIGAGAVISAEFQIQAWAIFVGILIPAIDNGDVGLEVSETSGGTFVPVAAISTGAALAVLLSGNDPAFIDISDFVRPVPRTRFENDPQAWFLRLTCAAQASGAVTCRLVQRG